jgi:transposase InsO family protein
LPSGSIDQALLARLPRDEFLNETLFTSLMHARLALEEWRRDYNSKRFFAPTYR